MNENREPSPFESPNRFGDYNIPDLTARLAEREKEIQELRRDDSLPYKALVSRNNDLEKRIKELEEEKQDEVRAMASLAKENHEQNTQLRGLLERAKGQMQAVVDGYHTHTDFRPIITDIDKLLKP